MYLTNHEFYCQMNKVWEFLEIHTYAPHGNHITICRENSNLYSLHEHYIYVHVKMWSIG